MAPVARTRKTLFNRFRNEVLIGATATLVRLLYCTVRFEVEGWGRARLEAHHGPGAIFALWHNGLMLPLGHESRKGSVALISPGGDGEFAARVVARFGVRAVRGSTSKGGARGAARMLGATRRGGSIVVTPDGPRGPRYRFQDGAAWLASRSGLPVIPVGIAVSRAWILRSWDRYRIPKPFSRAVLVFGDPLFVPGRLDRRALEPERRRLEDALHRASMTAAARVGLPWPD